MAPQRVSRMSTSICSFRSVDFMKPLFYSVLLNELATWRVGGLVRCPPRVAKNGPTKVDNVSALRWTSYQLWISPPLKTTWLHEHACKPHIKQTLLAHALKTDPLGLFHIVFEKHSTTNLAARWQVDSLLTFNILLSFIVPALLLLFFSFALLLLLFIKLSFLLCFLLFFFLFFFILHVFFGIFFAF